MHGWFMTVQTERLVELIYLSVFDNARSLRENECNDESVETEGFSENENEDHADEDLVLLSIYKTLRFRLEVWMQ